MRYRWLRKQRLFLFSATLFTTSIFFLYATQAHSQSLTAEGIRIQQEALIWTTDYEGRIDGKLGEGTLAAIKKFQDRLGNSATGALTDAELEALVKQGYTQRDAVKFRQYTDRTAGVSVGIPTGLLNSPTDTKWGKSWYDKKNELAIDTLRFTNDVSLRGLYDRLLSINNRKPSYQRFEDDWFAIAAFEKDAAVYVRANLVKVDGRPDEIRGYSIWMGPNRPKTYQAFAPAMLSSFRVNNDSSRDVSVLPMGGTINTPVAAIRRPPPPPPPPPQPTPIVAQNERPPTGKICHSGIGDCPRSIFLSFGP